jgi:hypothetical protein
MNFAYSKEQEAFSEQLDRFFEENKGLQKQQPKNGIRVKVLAMRAGKF